MLHLAAIPILAALAFISLPGWLTGIIMGKVGGIVVGYIVQPLMDALKRAWGWLDTKPATVKQFTVLILSIAVAFGLRAIAYTVPGCDVSTPDGCNPFAWSATVWTGVLGALVAFLLKAGKQASAAAKTATQVAAAVRTVAPATVPASATGYPSVAPPVARTPFTSPR